MLDKFVQHNFEDGRVKMVMRNTMTCVKKSASDKDARREVTCVSAAGQVWYKA
jgi:hypothetical protein